MGLLFEPRKQVGGCWSEVVGKEGTWDQHRENVEGEGEGVGITLCLD